MGSENHKPSYLIIGAGLSGLSAAITLHRAGNNVQILEADDRAGGRIKSDHVDGFILDRGFQVYLDAYSEGKRILDLKALDLRAFDPGALLLLPGGRIDRFSDPLRSWSGWKNIWSSRVGTFEDKMHMFSLRTRLLNQRSSSIFQKNDYATSKVLDRYSYSPLAQQNFFRPFFRGIFLEKDLATNRKMFDYVYKMFSAGSATLPAGGMEAIPRQLVAMLPENCIHYHKAVVKIEQNTVICADGSEWSAENIIIATPPGKVPGITQSMENKPWNGVTTLYFSSPVAPYRHKMLALNTREDALCNHLAVLSNVVPEFAPAGQALLSANIIGISHLSDDQLFAKVKEEMQEWFGKQTAQWNPLRIYRIPYALPNQESVNYDMNMENAQISEHLYQCGDFMLNGSIQAALRSGRQLGEHLIQST